MKYTPGIDGPAGLRARSAECLGLALGAPERRAQPETNPRAARSTPPASVAKDAFGFHNLPKPGRQA